jgi:hypothetical protein
MAGAEKTCRQFLKNVFPGLFFVSCPLPQGFSGAPNSNSKKFVQVWFIFSLSAGLPGKGIVPPPWAEGIILPVANENNGITGKKDLYNANFFISRKAVHHGSHEPFKPFFLRLTDRADIGRLLPCAEIPAHFAAPDGIGE